MRFRKQLRFLPWSLHWRSPLQHLLPSRSYSSPEVDFLTCSGIVGGLSENGCFKRPQVFRLQQNCVSALQRTQLCSVPLSSGIPERFEFCPSGFILHRIESLVKTLSHARQRLRSSGRGSLFQRQLLISDTLREAVGPSCPFTNYLSFGSHSSFGS